MVQKDVSLVHVLAGVGWSVAFAFTVLSLLFPGAGFHAVVVLASAGAAVLHVRSFIDGLERRVRKAFDYGREYERVRPVR